MVDHSNNEDPTTEQLPQEGEQAPKIDPEELQAKISNRVFLNC